jgi:hypothetical protein
MLYFRTQPDSVFIAFVKHALHWELQRIRRISSAKDEDVWEMEYPLLSEVFTPYSAFITLEELLVVNETSTVYRLTDYHWLLVYESLKNYCLWHNDHVHKGSMPFIIVGGYRFGPVDFDSMTDRYFWDQEFMEVLYANVAEPDVCVCEGNIEEPEFDFSFGLRPHPHKLQMALVEETAWHIPEPQECGQWRLP